MDSLNIDEFVDLAEILQVIHHVFAIERRSQKATETPDAAGGLLRKPLRHRSERHRLDGCLDCPGLTRFHQIGFVLKLHIQRWQTGRGVAQRIKRHNTGRQQELVGNRGFFP